MAEVRSQHRWALPSSSRRHRLEHGAVLHTAAPYDSWTILFWRGLFGGGMIWRSCCCCKAVPACGI